MNCCVDSVTRAGQLLFKNSHTFCAPNEVTVAEIFVGVTSCKSGILWVWPTLISMNNSFEILGAICGADCLEKNPFRKFKEPFPNLGKPSLLELPIEN